MKIKYIRWSTLTQTGARQLLDVQNYDLVLQEQISRSVALAKRPKEQEVLKMVKSGKITMALLIWYFSQKINRSIVKQKSHLKQYSKRLVKIAIRLFITFVVNTCLTKHLNKFIVAKFYFSGLRNFSFLKCCFIIFTLVTTSVSVVKSQTSNTITWSTAKSQPRSTHEVHGEVVNEKLYIFGGYDRDKRPAWTPTKRSYVYDPVANSWSPIADLPHTPNGANFGGITHVGLTNDGTDIYFAGGYTSNADGTGQLFGTRQVWKYNVASDTYTRLPDLPQACAGGQLRYLNGKIHYVGGADSTRKDVGVHFALNLNNLSAGWKTLAPLLNPVNHPGSTVYGGKIYFVGGAHGQDDNTVTQKTFEAYDETTDTWTKLSDLPNARDHISSSVVVMGDSIVVLGGETSHNALSKLVTAYSPATNTWTELTPLPEGKSAGVAGVLGGNIYYTGGNFSTTNYKGVPKGTILSLPDNPVDTSEPRVGRNLKKPVIYPNPVQKNFNIKFPADYKGRFSFTLTDPSGRTYNLGKMKLQPQEADMPFDVSNLLLPSGVYILKISSETRSDEIKLIIRK